MRARLGLGDDTPAAGALAPRDHYPDALIAQVAAHLGAAIVTANPANFRPWIVFGKLDTSVREGRD